MNKKQLWLLGAGIVLVLSSVFVLRKAEESNFDDRTSRYMANRAFEKTEGVNGYKEWLRKRIINPATGNIDNKAVLSARTKAQAVINKVNASRASVTIDDWTELGPYNHGGRTRALLIDQANPNRVFAAGVGGGLFKSENKGQYWERIAEIEDFLTTTALCQDQEGNFYVGTGESLYFPNNSSYAGSGSGGLPGNGIYKGTVAEDGSIAWAHLEETAPAGSRLTSANDDWSGVNELVAHPVLVNTVYAATMGGIYMTTDGGLTWSKAEGSPSSMITDIAIGTTAEGEVMIHATSSSNYYICSDDFNFVRSTENSGFPTIGSRAEVQVAPSDANYVYISNADNSGLLEGFYQSKDAGTTWTVITKGGSDFFEPFGQAGASGQGDYDNVIGVALDDPEEVYFGGVTLWKWTPETGVDKIAYNYDVGDGRFYVHSDMHGIVGDPTDSNALYFTNDGGVFASYNRGQWFTHLNAGYKTMQAYDATVGPYGEVIAGFQDNGTHVIDVPSKTSKDVYTSSTLINGGDGGEVAWSFINPNALFVASQYGAIKRSSNRGISSNDFYDDNAAPDQTLVGESWQFADFVTPFKLWENLNTGTYYDTTISQVLPTNAAIDSLGINQDPRLDTVVTELKNQSFFYAGLRGGIWMTKDALNFSIDPVWYKVSNFGSTVTPTSIEASNNGNTIWTSTDNGRIYRTTNLLQANFGYRFDGKLKYSTSGDSSVEVTGSRFWADSVGIENATITVPGASGIITSVNIDPNNEAHVIVTYGGYGGSGKRIWESTNAMDSIPSWTDISGDIDNWPVYDAVVDIESSNRIFVATEFGVFQTENTNGGSTSWTFVGPSKVATFALDQVSISDSLNGLSQTGTSHTGAILVAATHGRGIWATNYDICEIYQLSDEECSIALNVNDDNLEDISLVMSNKVSVYPNPVVSQATINLVTTDRSDINISAYNLSGALVYEQIYTNQSKGHLSFDIDLADVPDGIYILNTTVNGKVFKNKLIKLN